MLLDVRAACLLLRSFVFLKTCRLVLAARAVLSASLYSVRGIGILVGGVRISGVQGRSE